MRVLLAILTASLLLLLGGCAAQESRAEVWERVHGPECKKMGYAPDTDAYRDCKLKLAAIAASN
jgi:hypothetical protein